MSPALAAAGIFVCLIDLDHSTFDLGGGASIDFYTRPLDLYFRSTFEVRVLAASMVIPLLSIVILLLFSSSR